MDMPNMDRCPGCLVPLAKVQGDRGFRYECGSIWAIQTNIEDGGDPVRILGITKPCRERAGKQLGALIEEAGKAIYRVSLLDPNLVPCPNCKGMGLVKKAGSEDEAPKEEAN